MTIIIDDTIFQAFLQLQNKTHINDNDICEFLNISSYKEVIDIMGKDWNIGAFEKWFDLFSYALSCDTNITTDDLTITQRMYAEYIKRQYKNKALAAVNYDKLLINGDFLKLANEFLPENFIDNEIKIVIGVFCPNASGHKHIFLDVPFLMQFTDDDVLRLVAQKYCHIVLVNHMTNNQPMLLPAIEQALYWFQTEGVADLCSFEVACQLYESAGYAQPGSMKKLLDGIMSDIKHVSQFFELYIDGEIGDNVIIRHLSYNSRYHVLGYFMAKTLYENDPASIQNTVGDAYGFFNAYQKVCKSNSELNDYAFSFDIERCIIKY